MTVRGNELNSVSEHNVENGWLTSLFPPLDHQYASLGCASLAPNSSKIKIKLMFKDYNHKYKLKTFDDHNLCNGLFCLLLSLFQ